MKTCAKCGLAKDSSNFNGSRRRFDGLQVWCRQCEKEYKIAYKRANPEVVLRQGRDGSRKYREKPGAREILKQIKARHIKKKKVEGYPQLPAGATKLCRKCHTVKPLKEFTKQIDCRFGRGSWCLMCASAYGGSKSATRQSILDQAKRQPCADCQQSFPSFCLDFDHVRGVKSAQVSDMLTCNVGRLFAEIAKCEVVCANCHRVRTNAKKKPSKSARLQEFHRRVDAIKSAPCMDCRNKFPSIAMDLDHIRGKKHRMVSTMVNYSWDRVLIEITKCDLVCANCHRIRTQARILRRAA